MLGKQEKDNSFVLLGASFTAPSIAAMTSPWFCFLPSVAMCQRCLCCIVTRLASLGGCFPIPACFMCFSVQNAEHGLLATLTDRQHGCVHCMCCRTEVEVVDQTDYLIQLQSSDMRPTQS